MARIGGYVGLALLTACSESAGRLVCRGGHDDHRIIGVTVRADAGIDVRSLRVQISALEGEWICDVGLAAEDADAPSEGTSGLLGVDPGRYRIEVFALDAWQAVFRQDTEVETSAHAGASVDVDLRGRLHSCRLHFTGAVPDCLRIEVPGRAPSWRSYTAADLNRGRPIDSNVVTLALAQPGLHAWTDGRSLPCEFTVAPGAHTIACADASVWLTVRGLPADRSANGDVDVRLVAGSEHPPDRWWEGEQIVERGEVRTGPAFGVAKDGARLLALPQLGLYVVEWRAADTRIELGTFEVTKPGEHSATITIDAATAARLARR